jgi:hypothetical protein
MYIQKSIQRASILALCCVAQAAVLGQTTPAVTFQTVPLAVPGETMAFADFNGDGKQDAVGLDSKSTSIAVWLGNGDGTFSATPLETPVTGNPPFSFTGSKLIVANVHDAVPNNPEGVAFSVSQFNSNGNLVEYGVVLADGIGNGYFGLCENDIVCLPTSSQYTVGPTILGLVAADFLAPSYPSTAFAGFTDIVVATQFPDLTTPGVYDNSFLFYEGDGYGGLTNFNHTQNVLPAQTNATTPNPSAMAGDFLGNGYPYIVFNPGYATSNGVSSPTGLGLAVNNQDETFTASATPLLSGTNVAQYQPIDINADKKLDIVYTEVVTSSSPSTSIKAILGDGTGNFAAPATLVAAPSGVTGTLSFSFVDLNNDGKLDIVFSGQSSGLYWSSGNGDGTFNSAALITADDSLSSYVTYPQPALLGSTTSFAWGQKAAYVVVLGPALLLNPASTVNFGSQFVGSTSAPNPITLTNTGGQTLTLSSITASAGFSSTTNCAGTLAAGATCTVQVSFAPTATGEVTGTLTVVSNSPNSPQVENLSGTGTSVTVAPASGSSTSATISSGTTADFVLAVTPVAGFTGVLTTSCTGAPAGYQCVPSQATVNVTTTAQNVTFAVSPLSSAKLKDGDWSGAMPAVLFAGALIGFLPRRYRGSLAMCGLLFIGLAAFTGCGGGSGSKPAPTVVSSSYPLTAVFTTAGGQSIKQSLTLTITSNQ